MAMLNNQRVNQSQQWGDIDWTFRGTNALWHWCPLHGTGKSTMSSWFSHKNTSSGIFQPPLISGGYVKWLPGVAHDMLFAQNLRSKVRCACRWLRKSPVSSRFLVNNHCNLSSMYAKFTLSTWLAGKSVEIPYQMERCPWNFRIPSRFFHFPKWRCNGRFFPAMLLPPAAPLGSPSSAAAVNSAGRKGWSDPPTKKDHGHLDVSWHGGTPKSSIF